MLEKVWKRVDADGNGSFDYDEVYAIIKDIEEQKKAQGALVKMIGFLAIGIFALLGALMGIVFAANEGCLQGLLSPKSTLH